MQKNIDIQESHIRTIAGITLLLFTLLIVENAFIKILLAVIAAGLSITAFMHTCPIYIFLDKFISNDEVEDTEIKNENEEEKIETLKEENEQEKIENEPTDNKKITNEEKPPTDSKEVTNQPEKETT